MPLVSIFSDFTLFAQWSSDSTEAEVRSLLLLTPVCLAVRVVHRMSITFDSVVRYLGHEDWDWQKTISSFSGKFFIWNF